MLFLIGFLFLLLPLGIQFWEKRHQENVISTYWEKMEQFEETELETCLEEAKEYNAKLYQVIEMPDTSYQNVLNLSEDGIMGSIEIPKISLKLPIYHGTGEEVLSKGVGHLKDSSLPVGGESVHSVLTGHRGLPSAQLFTRLDELEKKDVFFIRVCNEILIYQVSEICVVKPEDVEVLRIREDQDRVSLITCTPYGLNTHRLIVTGERVEEQEVIETPVETNSISKRDLILIALAVLFLIIALRRWFRDKRGDCMKVRKYMSVLVLLMLLVAPMDTFAAEGNVKIIFPDTDQVSVSYTKVASVVDGLFVLDKEYRWSNVNLNTIETAKGLEEAAQKLKNYMKTSKTVFSDGRKTIQISGLEEGAYLFSIKGEKNFSPILIFIPTWMEVEKAMSNDVTVVPKYEGEVMSPKTGWNSHAGIYLALLFVSFGIIIRLSCHNHFKCARIALIYSKKGGYANGNDNDTKNPRCPRRIGFSGCRSID